MEGELKKQDSLTLRLRRRVFNIFIAI
jgi:transposase